MIIGIPKEIRDNEHRVAAVPETVAKMVKSGMSVLVESDAGRASHMTDEAYQKAGAVIAKDAAQLYGQSEVILKVQCPVQEQASGHLEIDLMKEQAVLIGFFSPLQHLDMLPRLNAKKITTFSTDFLPRIARAQSMDVLSSMSNIAGYKSVLLAANYLGKFFPMLMTAAGTIMPAKVLIIGAGVAGLQAIATARRLGAVVLAMDTRPVVAEQVKSLGAEFASLEVTHEQSEDTGGYAKELPPEFYRQEQEIIREHIKEMDVVITSAQIPGKRAPLLMTEEMVQAMKPGSVIVDLAVEQGGNCALIESGKIVVKHDVTLVGTLNLPSTMPIHASFLYARNMLAFLNHLVPDTNTLQLDLSNDITKSCLVTHLGETVNTAVKKALEEQKDTI
ncbi:MAG: NAD(P) transhydrogenase subunit alpha [Gammaproteobacteria bacterium RIFCSPHIGHO2_12_FULL_45_12]|nr:MAG: NAD(P) transhydrogenase subunit alpha [Gammaproteobacteria bacterium RIFCSPHIGHO2_12_FULL_45_12]